MLRVLFIDREQDIIQQWLQTWQDCSYESCFAVDFTQGIQQLLSFCPNMIVTEYALHDGKIVDFIRRINRLSDAPVVVLSACNDEAAVLAALRCGVDDFVRKRDCSGPELLLRLLRLRQRQLDPAKPEVSVECIRVGREILLDKGRHEVLRQGKLVELRRMEYKLFLLLLQRPNQLIRQDALMKHLFCGPTATRSQHRIRLLYTYLSGLRRKLGLVPPSDVYIKSVYGEGYCLAERGQWVGTYEGGA